MSIPNTQVWEIETGGSDTANGGGFDPANSNMATDGAATSATGASPVFSSASYNFQSSDVGAWLFIQSGTNWTPGWYKIASVAANAATLSAGIGSVVLWQNSTTDTNTSAGCATTAVPTGATWTVDYSQQSSCISLTGLTTASANAIILTSAATKAMVANSIQITGGTNFTTGIYSVSSVSAGISLTVDRNCTTAAGLSGSGGLGGALNGLVQLASVMTTSNRAFVQGGAYTQTATASFSGVNSVPTGSSPLALIIGYGTIRGDGERPTITLSTNSSLTCIEMSGSGLMLDGLIIDCNSLSGSVGVYCIQPFCYIQRMLVSNFASYGINSTQSDIAIEECEITAGLSSSTAAISTGSATSVFSCNIHDNSCSGILASDVGVLIASCLITNNTGSSSDGISMSWGISILNNTIDSNGRDGIRSVDSSDISRVIRGNILTNNGGYGLNMSSGVARSARGQDGNAYYNNTSGAKHNWTDVITGNTGCAPYINTLDVILAGNPYVNSSAGNYALNNTVGAGAACRAAGFPGTFPGGLTTGYLDIGAVQHQDSGGSTTIVINRNTNIFVTPDELDNFYGAV